jgi:two-component system, cell cycle sensor histidine kinase and response regulator CckA
VADTRTMLGRLIGEDVDLVFDLAPDLWRVKADRGQLEQVVMNLAINSRDAMPTGGKLRIETANVSLDEKYVSVYPDAHLGDHVVLSVTDTGCGMDAAVQARIFEPFFTTKGPEHGTGLGLATVYGIVKQSGGHIEVHSQPNCGAMFKIYLPRERGTPLSRKSLSAPEDSKGGSETVLIAEDEDAVRVLTRLALQREGYHVLEARHGQEALDMAEQYDGVIQLLLTDLVMPHLSGRQLAEHLQKVRPGIKVLYVSGYMDDAIIRHGLLMANTSFLQKPFSPDVLAQKVREVLDK